MKKLFYALAIVFGILLISSFSVPETFAQNELGMCAPLSIEYNFDNSDVIFYGIPIYKEPIEDIGNQIQIDVMEIYKGNIPKGINTIHTTKIQHWLEGTLYGDPFHELGKGYVVYAKNENGELWTSSDFCSVFVSFRADPSERFEFLPESISPLTYSEFSMNQLDEYESKLWWIENHWNIMFSLIGAIIVMGIIMLVIKKKSCRDTK